MSDTESQIRHLEMIQAVVARLAHNSFLIKGWSVFVGFALFGFSVREGSWPIAVLGSFAVSAFWGLDTYYLHREQMYRKLFEYTQTPESPVKLFSLRYNDVPEDMQPRIIDVARSFTVEGLHGPIVLVGLLLALVIMY